MAKNEKVQINGRTFSKGEVIEKGEQLIRKRQKARKVWGIIIIVIGIMAMIGGPVAKIQGTFNGIGEMIGALIGGLVIAGLGVLLFLKSKTYPSKCNPYEIGHKKLTKTVKSPASVVVDEEVIDERDIERPDGHYYVKRIKTTYEDGHTKIRTDERKLN